MHAASPKPDCPVPEVRAMFSQAVAPAPSEHSLCPALQAFLGEVATWTGIVTGTLMFASPALFTRWKWKGVAGATPAFMQWTGVPFFLGCMLYNVAHPTQGVGTAALRALVIVGAILQVPCALTRDLPHILRQGGL